MRYPLALLGLVAVCAAAPAGAHSATGCSGIPGARVELQAGGATPADVTLQAGQELDFLNETGGALTVTTSLQGETVSLQPGECEALIGGVGEYTYSVSGYPGGAAVAGTFSVTPAATVTITPHASIVYGQRTVLSGTANGGPPGVGVAVWSRPLDRAQGTQIAIVTPVHGSWSVKVAPAVGTEYTATFAGVQVQRVLSVQPDLRIRKAGHTIRISVVARLSHPSIWLFRFTPNGVMLWSGFRSTTADSNGDAMFKHVPTGRYYVAVLGNTLYLDNASEPFQVDR